MEYFLAIDIGASSGRHIAGWMEDGKIRTREIYRFPNGVLNQDGHLIWDVQALLDYVIRGIHESVETLGKPRSLSIDTWGVDYVLMNGENEILPCYAYRDGRTLEAVRSVHEKIPFSDLYRRTGIQFQPFNTIYQLYADKECRRLEEASDFLMMPEYLMYKLCGVKAHEYTNATTTGLITTQTGMYDEETVRRLGFPERLFGLLSQPGTYLGEYEGIPCVLCATHDTASAVEGIPTEEEQPFISSGTWSLLGIRISKALTDEASREGNWTNEGGVGYIRYLKNIMGMWIANRLRDELCPEKPFDEITAEAEASDCQELLDVNDPVFLAPESMRNAFDSALPGVLKTEGDYFRTAYRSLALCYRDSILELERNTGIACRKIYIVGGGAKNGFLNRLTHEFTGLEIAALPIEATALGNLKIQIRSDANR